MAFEILPAVNVQATLVCLGRLPATSRNAHVDRVYRYSLDVKPCGPRSCELRSREPSMKPPQVQAALSFVPASRCASSRCGADLGQVTALSSGHSCGEGTLLAIGLAWHGLTLAGRGWSSFIAGGLLQRALSARYR